MILIGSKAIKHHFPDFPRIPQDTDLVIPEYSHLGDVGIREFNGFPGIEHLKNRVLWDYYENPDQSEFIICGKNELYTIKMAHMFWDINWSKHLFDVQFLKDKGCSIIPKLFEDLYKLFNELHGKNKRSDLKMSADDFFDNAVKFPVPHDDLHDILIQHPFFEDQRCPTYQKVLIGEVEVSEAKFNMLTEIEKSLLVMEEVMVMATERYKMPYRNAYSRMLKKCIISHFPIWEAIWAIENFKRLEKAPFDFIKYLNEQINGNQIIKQPASELAES